MSIYESVYTNSLADVIGNDPVLDQFDIFYEASYYGSTQDDYVTGSLLNKIVGRGSKVTFTTGSRGRYFSKFYAANQQPLNSTYGSEAVNKNPSLSFRLKPLNSQVSRTAYRILQCHDNNERYYDSCLPDMSSILKRNESQIWSIENKVNAFSPYVNVTTSSVGYLLFDSIEVDRSSDGFLKDPTVFNGWTRSFPYESRYSEVQRLVSVEGQLGLGSRTLTLNWDSPKKDDLLLNTVTASGGFFGFPVTDKTYDTDIPSSVRDDISLSNLRNSPQKIINSFIPIVPGLLEKKTSADNFINGLRQKTLLDGGYGTVAINVGEYADKSLERETGYSLLFSSDVNLSKKITHVDYLAPYSAPDPGLEYVTGSMYTSDLVKFLFGFGDLNNVTYGRRTYDATKKRLAYNESFEDYSDGTDTYGIPNYKDQYIELNWQAFSSISDTLRPWRVSTRDDELVPTTSSDRNIYFFKSGSKPDSTSKGIKWVSGSTDFKALVSATSKYLNGPSEIPSGALGSSEFSQFFLDITSSYPWSFSYDRAICAATSDKLTVVFTAVPGVPSTISAGFPMIFIEQISGTGGGLVAMETYDFMEDGFLTGSIYNKNYPLPPGRWQISWQYSSGSSTTTNPSFAAINNLKFYTFADIEKSQMIGSNNLPDYSAKLTDRRIDPTFRSTALNDGPWSVNPTVASLHLSGTSDMYSSYVFGVSPVIRGWKYGLVNGMPQHTKVIFRRGKYGQFRDMLEQRQYTKFVKVNTSPMDFDAISEEGFNKDLTTTLPKQNVSESGLLESVVEVKFVRKTAIITQRGVGTIATQVVPPFETTSQNLSFEVTSSLPYFDLVPKHRTVEEMRGINRRSFVDTESVSATTQQLGLSS